MRDELDEDALAKGRSQIVAWMEQRIAALKAAGEFDAAARAVAQVGLRTLTVHGSTGVAEPTATYAIEASGVDLDRMFEEAGRVFRSGLQMDYWRANAERDALEVKIEPIVLARHAGQMAQLESQAEAAFDALYDQHKKA